VAGLGLCFVKFLPLLGGVCVGRGRRVGLCPWVSKSASPLKGGPDSSDSSVEEGTVSCKLASYLGAKLSYSSWSRNNSATLSCPCRAARETGARPALSSVSGSTSFRVRQVLEMLLGMLWL